MHQRHTLREHASGIERLALARREESAIAGWLREWEQRGNRGLAATEAVAKVLRSHKFDTVLGHIGFDANATSPATRLSSGTSGKTASSHRWNQASSPSEGRWAVVL
jgi:hypothetical protein